MVRDFYVKDRALAEAALSALSALKMDDLFPREGLLCDLYCIPSHNHQAFYTRIYGCGGVNPAVYAKSVMRDRNGCIYMYPFSDAQKAGEHIPPFGKIVCGCEELSKSYMEMLDRIIKRLPEMSYWEPELVCGLQYLEDDIKIEILVLRCVNSCDIAPAIYAGSTPRSLAVGSTTPSRPGRTPDADIRHYIIGTYATQY